MLPDTISLSILPLFGSPLLLFAYSMNYIYLYILIASYFVLLSTEGLKILIGNVTQNKLYYRPQGCKNCTLFNSACNPDAPAFPSGHMSGTVFVILTLLLVSKHSNPKAFWILGTLYVGLMAYARYAKKCHNLFQITGGVFYGTVCSLAFVSMFNSIKV
jgi:membrane-associated phospholipid phosphatase